MPTMTFTEFVLTDVLREAPKSPRMVPHVFCDVDGVLANFYAGMEHYFGVSQKDTNHFLTARHGWDKIASKEPHLFGKLPLLPDARQLVTGLVQLRDHGLITLSILTAIPDEWYHDSTMRRISTADKIQWVTRYFQRIPAQNVLVVRRVDKASYVKGQLAAGKPRPILIDDFGKNIREWEAAGGVGIQHTNAMHSLQSLVTMIDGG